MTPHPYTAAAATDAKPVGSPTDALESPAPGKAQRPRTVIITTVHGRHDHLRKQREALGASSLLPDEHLIITMDDDELAQALASEPASEVPTRTAAAPSSPTATLPLAAARNIGAELSKSALRPSTAAHSESSDISSTEGHAEDLLIFLDVDCIPHPDLVRGYLQAAQENPGALLCGPVAYLPETDLQDLSPRYLDSLAEPHPARPAPEPGQYTQDSNYDLFWSLSFAVRRSVWENIGGFDERFTGYGGEDTDFAQQARSRGVGLCWVGSARAYHQHHPVSNPPVEHLDDILANGRRFANKWGRWPMQGWIAAFQERGLVTCLSRDGDTDYVRTIRVASVPQSHVYIRHLSPPEGERSAVVRLPDPPARREDHPTGAPWWPPRMLDPEWILAPRGPEEDFDIFHIHFGFDAESPQRLHEVVDALDTKGVPLVYTVHDLQNPHHTDTALHTAQLDVLIPRAAAVITLSRRAAEIIEDRWGVRARVVPHPHVVDLPLIQDYGVSPRREPEEFRLGIHLKSLRQNMSAIPVLEAALEAVHGIPGGVLQVNVHRDVYDDAGPEFNPQKHDPELVQWLNTHPVDLRVHNYFTDGELYDYIAGLHASLLPYRFGTHSGWMEACHDLGTTVIAPDVGCYASQGADLTYRWRGEELDVASLRQAVRDAAVAHGRRAEDSSHRCTKRRQWRTDQRRQIAAVHEDIYRQLLQR
ncbi:galactosyltransferase-related protein [Nesterenkonia rhizosphaerae]|uniref:D-inositol 3-phosphate glycosyltransferase n=1 Tax=Nesterenkonia rhizosphaerae TaxID=1348272 RepID=A0ABP9FXT4_9MICC